MGPTRRSTCQHCAPNPTAISIHTSQSIRWFLNSTSPKVVYHVLNVIHCQLVCQKMSYRATPDIATLKEVCLALAGGWGSSPSLLESCTADSFPEAVSSACVRACARVCTCVQSGGPKGVWDRRTQPRRGVKVLVALGHELFLNITPRGLLLAYEIRYGNEFVVEFH